MYKLFAFALVIFVSACGTQLQVVELDPDTGYFPGARQAIVTTSMDIDLDKHKSLVLVPSGDFTSNMTKNIGYFDEVITVAELEKLVILNNLTEEIPSVTNRIGINKAAKSYKKFLWLRWDSRIVGNREYMQLVLTDPITLEDIFVSETLLDHVWRGVNDKANWYPMMNSLVDYIKKNSNTYQK